MESRVRAAVNLRGLKSKYYYSMGTITKKIFAEVVWLFLNDFFLH